VWKPTVSLFERLTMKLSHLEKSEQIEKGRFRIGSLRELGGAQALKDLI
jgi:hypothetical protein